MHRIPDQFVDLLRIVSLIHDIEVGFSGSVTLLKDFFSVRDIMDRVLRDLHSSDDLLRSIDCDGGFQEPFSCLSCSP